jgi:hypothetical protein
MKRFSQPLAKEEMRQASRRVTKDQGPKNFEEFLKRMRELEERLDEEINETLQAHNLPARHSRI